jgi:hypothetical protein
MNQLDTLKSNGSSVLNRYNRYLDEGYFQIDERSLSDLMNFIKDFSSSIQFINNDNKPEGDWSDFFNQNLAFQISTIASFDTNLFNQKYKKGEIILKNPSKTDVQDKQLLEQLKLILNLFQSINKWYIKSKIDVVNLSENILFNQLSNSIRTTLSQQLSEFVRLVEEIKMQSKMVHESELVDLSLFDKIWTESSDQFIDLDKGDTAMDLNKGIKELSIIFNSILGFANYMKSIAPKLLQDILTDYPYHPPHISLMIAFLKGYEHTQKDINNVLKKQLNYFYLDLLGQKLRLAIPDQVFVTFEASDHIVKYDLPKGTLLYAGIDNDGYEYNYQTDHAIELNSAKVSDLKLIHVAQNGIIGLGNTFKSVSNIFQREVMLNDEGETLDITNNPRSFDSFGKDQSDLSFKDRDMEQARIGFALSSPVLILKEGLRLVTLNYKFSLKSLSALISFIEEISSEEGLSADAGFKKIISNIFDIRVTTLEGWFDVTSYEIVPPKNWVSGEIQFQMAFDRGDPEILGYDPEVHGEGYSTEWPVFEFKLSSERAMYAYSFIKDLVIETCEIRVDVAEIKNLSVFNDLGKLDITVPFFPFGSTPESGAYFLIGNEEIFRKNITDFAIDIKWHNLPKRLGGFKTYYEAYNNDITNESFKVGITCLTDFQFRPSELDSVQNFDLFKSLGDEDRLDNQSSLDEVNIDKLKMKPIYDDIDVENFDNRSKTGFLKIELLGPEDGFGFGLYSELYAKALMENVPQPKAGIFPAKEKPQVAIPREPLSPLIREMTLKYSANTLITLDQNKLSNNIKTSKDQIYHLHPFGNFLIFDQGIPSRNHWFPQFNDEGYLIIGLENLHVPVELSLYFELEDNIQNEIGQIEIPSIKWFYLVDNEWIEFSENEIIKDGTHNFTTSGIVQLKIPTLINKSHDILPTDKYWIRASTQNNSRLLSKIKMIKNNGVLATWIAHKSDAHWEEKIPAGTINRLIQSRNEISNVSQPYPSFGGRNKESMSDLYMRVSERIQHKNRGITPEFIEKIILEAFPNLFQVKCINHFSHPDKVMTGMIKIIVIPNLQHNENFYLPKLDYYELKAIQAYVEKTISPFAKVEVVNTTFEKVKITGQIKVTDKSGPGEFMKRLQRDLRSFICPWFASHQREMNLGGSIERDDIMTFIESLDYVTYITKFSIVLIHYEKGKFNISDSASNRGTNNELQSTSPWSVLIPSEEHEIELIEQKKGALPEETKINTMKIGSDFVISREEEDEVIFPFYDHEKDTYYAIELDV